MTDALNPNHPTTRALEDQWHKIAALIMHKMGIDHVVISAQDIASMGGAKAVTAQELSDGLHFRLVDYVTGEKLARMEGGLPT